MANYDVDIEIILRGDRKLKDFQRQLDKINQGLSRLQETQKQVQTSNPFNAAGIRTTKTITQEYVEQSKVLNARLRVQKQSIKERERELKRLVDITNQVNAAKRADEQRAAAAARAGTARSKRASAAVTAGAFPLLFGGGAFQALGGAIGGAATGNMFGGATVALQVLGGAVDSFAAKAVELGQGLSETAGDFTAVATAAGLARTQTESYMNEIKKLGDDKEALRLATESLANVVGLDGVNALRDFGTESTNLANTFSQAMAQMQASLARLLSPLLGAVGRGVQGAVDVGAAQASDDPRLVKIQKEIKARQRGLGRDPTLPARDSIENRQAIRDLVKEQQRILAEIRQDQENAVRLTAERLAREQEIAKLTFQTPKQLRLQKALLKTNLDLTDKNVQKLEEQLITENLRVKEREILDFIAEKDLDGATEAKLLDEARLGADKERQRLRLNINSAEEAALKAQEAAARRLTAEEEKRQNAVNRRVKAVERELERVDKAFDRASSQLDDIINKHEDKMAFEREYSRLIEEGSTPAAAKQAIELQKQLLELDRGFEKQEQLLKQQVQSVKLSIEKARAEDATTAELQAQLDRLKEIEAEINKLPSKKGKAEGAIKESLAPETGRDKIEAEMKRVQEALNELIDPSNQVILAAQAIGDAFSESFKGLITGSMSAQEALANLFSRTADHFADMAAEMIAHAIRMQILGIAVNFFSSAASAGAAGPKTPAPKTGSAFQGTLNPPGQFGSGPGFASPSTFAPPKVGDFNLPPARASEGGYFAAPTRALVGEGGEPEFVIPESKMRESMARYSRGARGGSVIPENGGSGTSGEGGGTAVAAPIDVRYTVERINSVDYVTADQFQTGMRQAASQGAKQGEQQTLKRLQMSSSTRKRIGM